MEGKPRDKASEIYDCGDDARSPWRVIAAVQEIQAANDNRDARIMDLEAEVSALKAGNRK
jgi:hypothetical protein